MRLCVIIAYLVTFASFAQIEIIQFSAEFLKDNEISLDKFKDHSIQTLYMGKNAGIFKRENIKYLPTVILYSDGEVMLKIESGISLELPKNTEERIQEKIDELLNERF
tara:strand:+ start:468 stop:791 length:324 start_codon:yes stop_codon:yes gene_type:complete